MRPLRARWYDNQLHLPPGEVVDVQSEHRALQLLVSCPASSGVRIENLHLFLTPRWLAQSRNFDCFAVCFPFSRMTVRNEKDVLHNRNAKFGRKIETAGMAPSEIAQPAPRE